MQKLMDRCTVGKGAAQLTPSLEALRFCQTALDDEMCVWPRLCLLLFPCCLMHCKSLPSPSHVSCLSSDRDRRTAGAAQHTYTLRDTLQKSLNRVLVSPLYAVEPMIKACTHANPLWFIIIIIITRMGSKKAPQGPDWRGIHAVPSTANRSTLWFDSVTSQASPACQPAIAVLFRTVAPPTHQASGKV